MISPKTVAESILPARHFINGKKFWEEIITHFL
jgi:hypothetical protein